MEKNKDGVMVQPHLIIRDREILGGTPVFAGTRVPVQTLFDYLEGGYSLQEFLDDFPTRRAETSGGRSSGTTQADVVNATCMKILLDECLLRKLKKVEPNGRG